MLHSSAGGRKGVTVIFDEIVEQWGGGSVKLTILCLVDFRAMCSARLLYQCLESILNTKDMIM